MFYNYLLCIGKNISIKIESGLDTNIVITDIYNKSNDKVYISCCDTNYIKFQGQDKTCVYVSLVDKENIHIYEEEEEKKCNSSLIEYIINFCKKDCKKKIFTKISQTNIRKIYYKNGFVDDCYGKKNKNRISLTLNK